MKYKDSWNLMEDKFKAKLSKWKANLLSIGGRLALTKSVLGSLGIFYFSIFKAPESILNTLERLRARFFERGGGGGDKDHTNMAWVKWDIILASLDQGGLGVGSLKAFNIALLQNWRWRLITNHILYGLKSLKQFTVWKTDLMKRAAIQMKHGRILWDLPTTYTRVTSFQKWRRLVTFRRTEEMLRTLTNELRHTTLSSEPDSCMWSLSDDGLFSVAVTRRHIDQVILPSVNIATRWNNVLPKKVNIFIWRLRLDRLPHRLNLSKRGLEIDFISCPICNNHVESNNHIFFSCDVASSV
ncbi:RNA-directed DNA polymerase, eukaryota, reverse transcriptase zinc-binding domain protein [Tanacetum coccineum]